MLKDYLDSGGGIILDSLEPSEPPTLFPVSKLSTMKASFNLTASRDNEIVNSINLKAFSNYAAYVQVIFAQELREGAENLLNDGDYAVIARWNYGHSKVIWSGLNLPYLAMLQGNIEASKMLVQMLNYASTPKKIGGAKVTFDLKNERVITNVKNATVETGIWVKVSYDSRWVARVNGEELRIAKAGPGTMLVFPMCNGDYTLELVYGKSILEQIGEAATLTGLIAIPVSLLLSAWKIPKGWTKTKHSGAAISQKIRRQWSPDKH